MNDCRSIGSNIHPFSQSRKISIGAMAESKVSSRSGPLCCEIIHMVVKFEASLLFQLELAASTIPLLGSLPKAGGFPPLDAHGPFHSNPAAVPTQQHKNPTIYQTN